MKQYKQLNQEQGYQISGLLKAGWKQMRIAAEVLKADIYFVHTYHSWERGLNENSNGLLRHKQRLNERCLLI